MLRQMPRPRRPRPPERVRVFSIRLIAADSDGPGCARSCLRNHHTTLLTGLSVSNSAGIPPEFILAIKGEGFETTCRVIAQDRQNLEVAF